MPDEGALDMPDSPWPIIHAERRAILEDVRGLSAEQWATESLCPGWSVRDVFGHMAASARMTPTRFIGHFTAAGFKFNKMVATDIVSETSGSIPDQIAAFTGLLGATTSPPGPVDAMVGEAVVHSSDIRRPLRITRDYPVASVIRAADFYKSSNLLLGTKSRIAGVTLKATDSDWTHGSGPEANGPMLSLLLAMTGRKVALADLTGEGVAVLQSR
jgi:uncharacterized protein (TIGR03083 family)